MTESSNNKDRIIGKPSDIEKFRLKEGENSFDFKGVIFKCKLEFSNREFGKIIFDEVVFEKEIKFNNTIFTELASFDNAKFLVDIDFYNVKFSGAVSFFNTQFSGSTSFYNSNFLRVVSFFNAQFAEDADFSEANFSGRADYNNVKFSGTVSFLNSQFAEDVDFHKCEFLNIASFLGVKFALDADFSQTQFKDNADFTKINFLGSIDFTQAAFFGNAFYNEVTGVGVIKFHHTVFKKNAEFVNSNINKSLFKSVLFEEVYSFSGTVLGETDFFGSVFNRYGLFKNCDIKISNRETFGIVKHELLKLDNKIDALIFHKKEMDCYWSELWDRKWYLDFSEKFILIMNRISNDFGQNWMRGIAFTLITALIFFIPYMLCLKNPYFVWGWESSSAFWEVTGQTVKYYVEFFYAAHKFDFMEQYSPRGFGYILDMIGRIFITYGYYQTIQAFRKYVRW